MQTFNTFFINHKNLPSLTSLEVLLRHYNSNSLYKTEIERLLSHAIKMQHGIFDKTVAFAILNISNWNNIDVFCDFFNALDVFLKLNEADASKRALRFAMISTFALEKLEI
jgi:hypothetical protein